MTPPIPAAGREQQAWPKAKAWEGQRCLWKGRLLALTQLTGTWGFHWRPKQDLCGSLVGNTPTSWNALCQLLFHLSCFRHYLVRPHFQARWLWRHPGDGEPGRHSEDFTLAPTRRGQELESGEELGAAHEVDKQAEDDVFLLSSVFCPLQSPQM